MPERGMIQFISALPPVWEELIHQDRELVIVVPLDQMHHLVNENVLKAMNRFFG
jgi:hypothetical protein